MSPLGEKIAAWLRQCPGPVYGDTPMKTWMAAKAKCDLAVKLPKGTLDQEFIAGMVRVGYDLTPRSNFSTTRVESYILALPEGN